MARRAEQETEPRQAGGKDDPMGQNPTPLHGCLLSHTYDIVE
jgi:hypothetical protein